MKPYGNVRRDMLTCRYGCCTTSYHKKSGDASLYIKARRKTARQKGKFQILSALNEVMAKD